MNLGLIGSGAIVGISSLTMENGKTTEFGGGIDYLGSLTLTNDVISGNSVANLSGAGGGIYNAGSLNLSNSTISGNWAKVGGVVENEATMSITSSTIADNTAISTAQPLAAEHTATELYSS